MPENKGKKKALLVKPSLFEKKNKKDQRKIFDFLDFFLMHAFLFFWKINMNFQKFLKKMNYYILNNMLSIMIVTSNKKIFFVKKIL